VAELSITELSEDIRAAIAELKARPEIEDVGVVTRVGDGIAWIYGLSKAGYNEMLEIEGVDGVAVTAFAFNLGEDEIGAVLLGEDTEVKAGAKVGVDNLFGIRAGAGDSWSSEKYRGVENMHIYQNGCDGIPSSLVHRVHINNVVKSAQDVRLLSLSEHPGTRQIALLKHYR